MKTIGFGDVVTLRFDSTIVVGTVSEHFGSTIHFSRANARDLDMGILSAPYNVDGVMYGTEGATIEVMENGE